MSSRNPPLQRFLSRFILQPPPVENVTLPRRQAAVLVPIVAHPCPTLLLTRRSASLRKHAGQVAFPGGMRDAEDESLVITALREAQEEVAIPPEAVKVIGVLPPVTSSTGFQVTPVIGIIPPGLRFYPNEGEVESVFEMPLEEALRLGRYQPLDVHRGGLHHRVWLSWYDDYFIWGMTAGIIRRLSLQVEKSAQNG
ncbi:CoA pyrophosphatase [Erwinia sp. JUb26]|uniref:CoA pyrophosphatase n=1 Tax=Erwinia sp. JUb26 TaxID=2485126 RepID=UPI000F48149E|nr:CoA pyrophosphatase [Erwinia sp. JUb26]ROR14801.1 8-oxo-dGTP pyrophosphatase MutT (NUDIX family) [Erwinia sp. JUb26]